MEKRVKAPRQGTIAEGCGKVDEARKRNEADETDVEADGANGDKAD